MGAVERSLQKQMYSKKRLGDKLIEEGFVLPQHTTHGVHLQQKLPTSVVVAILACAAIPDAEAAAAKSAICQIKVEATVLPYTTLKVHNQKSTITITAADISRGYVDIPGASSIEVATNTIHAYYLSFETIDSQFRQLEIGGLGRPAVLNSGSGIVSMPTGGKIVRMELRYRFILGDNAQPGIYPWPVTISVMPL